MSEPIDIDFLTSDLTPEPEKRGSFIRAPFQMPGAKFNSLPHLIKHLPIRKDSVWVDVFGGTGCVSWNVPACKNMIYNDRYSAVVDFYKVFRERQQELRKYLEQMPPHSRQEWFESRDTWVTEQDPLIRAAKWYYMVKLSVIQKGEYFGRSLGNRENFVNRLSDTFDLWNRLQNIMKRFTMENLGAFECLEDFDSVDTIFYLDPPYIDTDQTTYKHKWTLDDQRHLLNLIPQLKGFVALSHYPSINIDEQTYWTRKEVWNVKLYAHTNSRDSNKKVDQVECLWIKE